MPVGVRAAETMYTGGRDDMLGILNLTDRGRRSTVKERFPLNNNRRPFSIVSLSGPVLAFVPAYGQGCRDARDAIGEHPRLSPPGLAWRHGDSAKPTPLGFSRFVAWSFRDRCLPLQSRVPPPWMTFTMSELSYMDADDYATLTFAGLETLLAKPSPNQTSRPTARQRMPMSWTMRIKKRRR